MAKQEDDAIARTVAENHLNDALLVVKASPGSSVEGLGREILSDYPTVRFETAVSRVKGREIPLRRVVITGEWEVDPNAPKS